MSLPRLFATTPAAPDVRYRREQLIDAVDAAGLRGRGGAAFPTAVKLRAVAAARGRRAVVINAAEGEPLSGKDRALIESQPELVVDGALLAADAVGAREVVFAVKDAAAGAQAALHRAAGERRDAARVSVRTVPERYVASEESALLQRLNGGPAKPTLVPPRPVERGLGRRPTLVSNVETIAHVALIARHGPGWFREVGPAEHPGSALITLAGAVARPGVYEIALGTPVARVIGEAGGATGELRAVLVGGYSGGWVSAAGTSALSGSAIGAGVVVALPSVACPAAEVSRVVRWMTGESAGQCGPCVHGLDAIAGAVESIVAGTAPRDVLARLERWSGQVEGRGACHHPNGVVRFLRSALEVFAAELADHARYGPCEACVRRSVLAVPALRQAA
jgi:NADH:ubiquinone oxidoreductase subunit F (NADH-binding)